MADTAMFLELSALLTGLHNILLDPEDRALATEMAAEYERRLRATLGADLTDLVDAYGSIRSTVTDWSPALLPALQATAGFKAKESLAARQIVNIWYFSQFTDVTTNVGNARFFDGGFYERGKIWPLIKAHPIGFSDQPHGYWAIKPE